MTKNHDRLPPNEQEPNPPHILNLASDRERLARLIGRLLAQEWQRGNAVAPNPTEKNLEMD